MRILTGDRPTGKLHLGHYVGSLENRIKMQELGEQLILIADIQAMTDNYNQSHILKENIFSIVCDYLSVGIDPLKSTIFIQSMIPEIAELTIFFMNLVTVARLERNPTVKSEIKQKGFEKSLPVGFFTYPISQAADILIFKPTHIPVGDDQLPMIEQTNEIARTFNNIYKIKFFNDVEAVISKISRLVGLDGKSKMSKSLNNAIFLCDNKESIDIKVKKMYTDSDHINIKDPGKIEGNVVFTYLDAFDKNENEIKSLKEDYQKGGLADSILKKRLSNVLNNFLDPIREKRKEYEKKPDIIWDIIKDGTKKAQEITKRNMSEIFSLMKMDYFI
jgi:tryptophanyl-tRNA synthetase